MTEQEFKANWNMSPLVRAEESVVQKLNLPESASRFLTEIGLPERPLFDEFLHGIPSGLPSILDILPKGLTMPVECESLYMLGQNRSSGEEDQPSYLCLEKGSGRVLYVDATYAIFYRGRVQIALYNSSIPQMAECLLTYHQLKQSILGAYSYQQQEENIARYEAEYKRLWQLYQHEEFSYKANILMLEIFPQNSSEQWDTFFKTVKREFRRIDREAMRRKAYPWPNYLLGMMASAP